MSGKNSKKKRREKAAMPETVLGTMSPLDENSFVYGFLQSRGYDLVPRIIRSKGVYTVGLYYDRGGDKGLRCVGQMEMKDEELRKPRHLNIAMEIVARMTLTTPPRSPSPMGEVEMRQLRNELLGQLHDGVNADIAIQTMNQVAGVLTRHLRATPMQFEFPEDEQDEEQPTLEVVAEDTADDDGVDTSF